MRIEFINAMGKPQNRVQINNRFPTYNDYLSHEWEKFRQSPERWKASLDAVSEVNVRRALDIGCGAGQEMLPFVSKGAEGVGIDVMPEVGQVGRQLYSEEGLIEKVTFLRASGNHLPFADETFDVLICRVALSFMDNKSALREMARVMAPGGKFLLKYQSPNYYWNKLRSGIVEAYPKSSIYAARVLYAGYVYQLTGRQTYDPFTAAGEIFQTERTLKREIEPLGLRVTGYLPDTNVLTPSVVITKQ